MDATAALTLQIGASAPDFVDLLGVDGQVSSLSSFDQNQLLVVVFTSNGCPTVRAYEDRLAKIETSHRRDGVGVVAINANNPYLSPGDSHAEMVRRAHGRGYSFPYLKDEDGSVARAYGAVCTPHAFVFDQERRLRYQGRIDDSRDPEKVTSRDLENALVELLAGEAPTVPMTPPFGCAIVW